MTISLSNQRDREQAGLVFRVFETSKKTTFRPKASHSISSFSFFFLFFFASRLQSSLLAPDEGGDVLSQLHLQFCFFFFCFLKMFMWHARIDCSSFYRLRSLFLWLFLQLVFIVVMSTRPQAGLLCWCVWPFWLRFCSCATVLFSDFLFFIWILKPIDEFL